MDKDDSVERCEDSSMICVFFVFFLRKYSTKYLYFKCTCTGHGKWKGFTARDLWQNGKNKKEKH